MTVYQIIIIVCGMLLSLGIGYFWGWTSAFKLIDSVIKEVEDQEKNA